MWRSLLLSQGTTSNLRNRVNHLYCARATSCLFIFCLLLLKQHFFCIITRIITVYIVLLSSWKCHVEATNFKQSESFGFKIFLLMQLHTAEIAVCRLKCSNDLVVWDFVGSWTCDGTTKLVDEFFCFGGVCIIHTSFFTWCTLQCRLLFLLLWFQVGQLRTPLNCNYHIAPLKRLRTPPAAWQFSLRSQFTWVSRLHYAYAKFLHSDLYNPWLHSCRETAKYNSCRYRYNWWRYALISNQTFMTLQSVA